MKNNFAKGLLVLIMIMITLLILFIFVSYQKEENHYNIKEGDVLKFEDNIKVTILNVSDSFCSKNTKCNWKEQIEVSVKIDYNNESSNYTLKTLDKPNEKIKNSNYYITLAYLKGKIILDIKDKTEI